MDRRRFAESDALTDRGKKHTMSVRNIQFNQLTFLDSN